MNRPYSVGVALLAGLLSVHGPILFFFAGPLAVLALYSDSAVVSGRILWLVFLCLAFGFGLGWTWWDLTMPRWRVWAYEHVRDFPKLRRWAVAVGLSWSDGCLIVMTEKQAQTHRPLTELRLGIPTSKSLDR